MHPFFIQFTTCNNYLGRCRSDVGGAVVVRTYDFEKQREFPAIVMDRRLITAEVGFFCFKCIRFLTIDDLQDYACALKCFSTFFLSPD